MAGFTVTPKTPWRWAALSEGRQILALILIHCVLGMNICFTPSKIFFYF